MNKPNNKSLNIQFSVWNINVRVSFLSHNPNFVYSFRIIYVLLLCITGWSDLLVFMSGNKRILLQTNFADNHITFTGLVVIRYTIYTNKIHQIHRDIDREKFLELYITTSWGPCLIPYFYSRENSVYYHLLILELWWMLDPSFETYRYVINLYFYYASLLWFYNGNGTNIYYPLMCIE